MPSKQRPDLWIGHVTLATPVLEDTAAFMRQIGLRPIFADDEGEVAVLELRGGTHIVLLADGDAGAGEASFDLMVEDVDATHARFLSQGLTVSDIERGSIHDSFYVTEPGGQRIQVNSSHVPDHDAV